MSFRIRSISPIKKAYLLKDKREGRKKNMLSCHKVLFVARVDSHILHFHLPYLQWFQQKGYEVHVASQGNETIPYCDRKFDLAMDRFPISPANWKAYQRLKELMDLNRYSLVHCHTPTGGVLTRLAAREARKQGTSVLYTAHGFHFYDAAPLVNWLFFYPAEKLLAPLTDCLITINRADYDLAVKKHFAAGELCLIPGVGIDLQRFSIPSEQKKKQLRRAYGISEQTFLMVYVAELSRRKNQTRLLLALSRLRSAMPDFRLLLVGDGVMEPQLRQAIGELKLDRQVELLGYQHNTSDFLSMSDLGISVSRQEGLPLNVLEYQAQGLPVLLSDIRGHREILRRPEQGELFSLQKTEDLEDKLLQLYKRRNTLADPAFQQIRRQMATPYTLDHVMSHYVTIYEKYLNGKHFSRTQEGLPL